MTRVDFRSGVWSGIQTGAGIAPGAGGGEALPLWYQGHGCRGRALERIDR